MKNKTKAARAVTLEREVKAFELRKMGASYTQIARSLKISRQGASLQAGHALTGSKRWRLILLGSRFSEIAPPEPTHYATGRANFRGGHPAVFRVPQKV